MRLPKITLPSWPPQDWRAWAALLSGIAGGAALTVFAVWVVWIISYSDGWTAGTERERIAILGRALTLLLVGVIAVLLAQGFAINRRKISIGKDGINMEGGGSETLDRAARAAEHLPTKET